MPPFITVWIYVGNRVVVAISVKVETVYRFGVKILYAVGRYKSADFRVIIPCFKEIQFGFDIVIISAITERVYICKLLIFFIVSIERFCVEFSSPSSELWEIAK